MPRTKRRTVKRSSADMNMTAVNATMANQSKNMKEILSEFDCESNINCVYNQTCVFNLCLFFCFSEQNIEDYFSDIFDNQRNLIENSFLMTKMNLGDLLNNNLYDTVSFITSVKSIVL